MNAEKQALRAAMKTLLKNTPADERRERSQKAADLFLRHPAYRAASIVLAFLSMPSEPDTGPLIERALADGKRVAVPRIDGGDLSFVELDEGWKSWPRDRWDIPQPPASAPALSPMAISAVNAVSAVPGLAFDGCGGRLGRGKGYYDRWLGGLARARSALGALAGGHAAVAYGYATQLVESVPAESHDVPLDDLALG